MAFPDPGTPRPQDAENYCETCGTLPLARPRRARRFSGAEAEARNGNSACAQQALDAADALNPDARRSPEKRANARADAGAAAY